MNHILHYSLYSSVNLPMLTGVRVHCICTHVTVASTSYQGKATFFNILLFTDATKTAEVTYC
jgi:hypothetical protein